jgi:hypothetical protein
MPTTSIKQYQIWNPDEFKLSGYQKDNFGFATDSDQWVNWVLLLTLLLVLTLEVIMSNQLPTSLDRSLDAIYTPRDAAATQAAQHPNGAYYGLNFRH